MTLASTINGIRVVVPGVYSTVEVEDNLANLTPGPRNILIFGEASKGIPGTLVDLSRVFFTDYESLKAFYGSGTLVDAARMIFQQQASPEFAGAVNRVYTFKTNASTLAQRDLVFNSGVYAAIAASEYGENGNLISSQIQNATLEILPSVSTDWLPTTGSFSLKVRISGKEEHSLALAPQTTPEELASALNGVPGLSASGGSLLELIGSAQEDVDTLSLTPDLSVPSRVTVECSAPWAGTDLSSIQPGRIVLIPDTSVLAGPSGENSGSYVIVSRTSSTLVLDKISNAAMTGSYTRPVAQSAVTITDAQSDKSTAEIMVWQPVSVSVDESTAPGTGAALEIYMQDGDKQLAHRFFSEALLSNPVSAAAALTASVSLTTDASQGTFQISGGAFQNLPKAGDVLWIKPSSVLAGPSDVNVGAWVVTSAGTTTISAVKAQGSGASVASTPLAGQTNPFQKQPALASTELGAKLHVSSAERQVRILASRQSDGATFPQASVGGRIVLEMAYAGTSATLSITKSGKLQTTVSGGSGAALDILLAKFATMSDLIAFINSKTGYSAKVSDNRYRSLSPKDVLDQVDAVGIATGHATSAYPGRIKSDYADFKALVDDNFGLISFVENASAVRHVGLPDAETSNQFLNGGSIGGTTSAEIAAALDAALKVEVTQVVPLFSRDASADIEDGLTDSSSSYSIDAINALVKGHVTTASSLDYRKERFGIVSFHGSFQDAQQKAAEIGHERIQMFFQMSRTVGSDGTVQWFLPWMAACAAAAGRVQAALGTSLLRKSFQLSDVKHLGEQSIYSDSLLSDFDPDTKDLDAAIEAGLATLRPVTGFGVRMESPDLSTRSRQNDPKGWVFERVNVQFTLDEVLKTARTTLENFIGRRTTDVTTSVIGKSLTDILSLFVAGGSLKAFSIDSIRLDGNTYKVTLSVFPTEAVEFVTLDVLARRDTGAA